MASKQQKIAHWLGAGSLNIFGDPFAGKDTQARILADMFDGVVIGGGEIMRSLPQDATEQLQMATGGLVSSDLYLNIITPYFSRPELHNKPLILSTVGRRDGEQQGIMEVTTATHHPMRAVLLLNLPEEEVWRRFDADQLHDDRGGRADDKRDKLSIRLEKFRTDTVPVLEFYREKGLLVEIDGNKPPEEVTRDILEALYERASRA